MEKQHKALSAAQIEVMNVIWDRGEAGVGEIWRTLRQHRPVARNTVQTMVARLHERGWLKCRVEGQAYLYSAARPRKRTLSRMVGRLVETAFGGSPSGLVLALIEDGRISKQEAARIREAIDRAQERGQSRD